MRKVRKKQQPCHKWIYAYIYFALKRNALCVIIFCLNLCSWDACSRMHQGGLLNTWIFCILNEKGQFMEIRASKTNDTNELYRTTTTTQTYTHTQKKHDKKYREQHNNTLTWLSAYCVFCFLVFSCRSLRISYGSQVFLFNFVFFFSRKTIRHCKSISHRSSNDMCTHVLLFLFAILVLFFALFFDFISSMWHASGWKQYKYSKL